MCLNTAANTAALAGVCWLFCLNIPTLLCGVLGSLAVVLGIDTIWTIRPIQVQVRRCARPARATGTVAGRRAYAHG